MAKINVNNIAAESIGEDFDEFVNNFQNNIQNLGARNAYDSIKNDKEYKLDEDGYIIGDVWTEAIAIELMELNGFVANQDRLDALQEGRNVYGNASLPVSHADISNQIGMDPASFLKLFPKYPVVYFTRWGGMRKPFNLQELIDNPVRR